MSQGSRSLLVEVQRLSEEAPFPRPSSQASLSHVTSSSNSGNDGYMSFHNAHVPPTSNEQVSTAHHQSHDRTGSFPTEPTTTSSLISDLADTVESPAHERDEEDVLSELGGGGGSYASRLSSRRSRRLRGSGSGSGSGPRPASFSSSVYEDRMSVNPAREIAESLRSVDSVSSMASAVNGDHRGNHTHEADMDVHVDEAPPSGLEIPRTKMEGALPDDDGMQSLRQNLQEVRTLAVSTEEKARMMHFLMMNDYLAHKANVVDGEATVDAVKSLAGPVDPKNPFNLRSSDLEPSFSPLPAMPRDANGDADESMDDDATLPMLGCMHYKRNVKVQCFDCHRWFPCRHCHDQALDLPFPHPLNRKRTQNMLCMLCRTPQPAAEVCANCGEYAAWYYCPKCKLWDNDNNKRIYHCDDCGICRVGEGLGKDYVHCRRCNVCISISTSTSHPCIERATEGDCPLCLVRLFESPTPVVSLPCGHYMHGMCYRDLMAVTYKCPVCSKSAVNMELQWRKLDDEIRAQPMPEEDDEDLEGLLPHVDSAGGGADEVSADSDRSAQPSAPRRPREVWIGCNDCGGRCWTPFHWLGLKCRVCDSYNTNQMAPTAVQETDAERVIRQQQQHHHRQHDFTGDAVLRDAGIGVDDDEARADSMLDVPHSPSYLPATERRASGAQSPGRRYFVQEEEQRRPSFTGPRFSAPSIPTLPDMPRMPRMPHLPNLDYMRSLPNMPNMRNLDYMRSLPNMPNMPNLDYMRNLPNMPNMPNLELPRFSPYEMFDAVSRSLSPMRYYLQGLDVLDREGRGQDRSPTSVRSDPMADATRRKRRASGNVDEAVNYWGLERDFGLGEDEVRSGRDGDGEDVEMGEGRDGDDEDDDDDDDDDEDDFGDDDDEGRADDREEMDLELFGHR